MMSGTEDNPIEISDDEIGEEIVQEDIEETITVAIADSTISFSDIGLPHVIDMLIVRMAIACICVGILYVIIMFLAFS